MTPEDDGCTCEWDEAVCIRISPDCPLHGLAPEALPPDEWQIYRQQKDILARALEDFRDAGKDGYAVVQELQAFLAVQPGPMTAIDSDGGPGGAPEDVEALIQDIGDAVRWSRAHEEWYVRLGLGAAEDIIIALRSRTQEPVAWRWRYIGPVSGPGEWFVVHQADLIPSQPSLSTGFTVESQPLYAVSPRPR